MRLRKQTAEYEKMMQEIRRLNLKTVEVSEQVSQMLSCGIEQLEEYEVKLHGLIKEEETDKTEAAADAQQINQVITQELAQQKKRAGSADRRHAGADGRTAEKSAG